MRTKVLFALVAMLAAVCNPPSEPTPININVGNNQTQIVNAPNPSPSASPGTGVAIIDHVFVGDYGEDCPVPLAPATSPNEVRIGCTASLTCSPKDKEGRDIPSTQHPPAPDFFGVIYGAEGVQFHQLESPDSTPYNAKSKILGGSTSTYACTVAGVQTRNPLTLKHVS